MHSPSLTTELSPSPRQVKSFQRQGGRIFRHVMGGVESKEKAWKNKQNNVSSGVFFRKPTFPWN